MENVNTIALIFGGVVAYSLLLRVGSKIVFKSFYEEKTKYKENKHGKSDG